MSKDSKKRIGPAWSQVIFVFISTVIFLLLSSCGAATETQAPAATEPPATQPPTDTPTEAPTEAATTAPTEAPTTAAIQTPTSTPVPPEVLEAQLNATATQLSQDLQKANIAFIVPDSMKLEETVRIDLTINRSESAAQLSTEVAESSGYATNPAGTLVTNFGSPLSVEVATIQISDLMIAELKGKDFVIETIHTDPIQPITDSGSTTWSWRVTPKERGNRTLTLAISRLVTVQGESRWLLLRSYEKDITVQVTPLDIFRSIDWKWILGILVTALLIPLFFRWYDARRKAEVEPTAPPKMPRRSPKKKQ